MSDINSITIEEAIEAYEKYGITFDINDGQVVGYGVEEERFTEEEISEKGREL